MAARRAAALALLALVASGCDSDQTQRHEALPARGPAGVMRIGVANMLWPLDPTHAKGRDEVTLARALFATPLRTDPRTGAVRAGLCSSWHATGSTWRLRCAHSGAIAAQLRRAALFQARSIRAPDEHTLVISLRAPRPELPLPADAGGGGPAGGARALPADLGEPGSAWWPSGTGSDSRCARSSRMPRSASSARAVSTRRRSRWGTCERRSSTRSSPERFGSGGCSRPTRPSSSPVFPPRSEACTTTPPTEPTTRRSCRSSRRRRRRISCTRGRRRRVRR